MQTGVRDMWWVLSQSWEVAHTCYSTDKNRPVSWQWSPAAGTFWSRRGYWCCICFYHISLLTWSGGRTCQGDRWLVSLQLLFCLYICLPFWSNTISHHVLLFLTHSHLFTSSAITSYPHHCANTSGLLASTLPSVMLLSHSTQNGLLFFKANVLMSFLCCMHLSGFLSHWGWR